MAVIKRNMAATGKRVALFSELFMMSASFMLNQNDGADWKNIAQERENALEQFQVGQDAPVVRPVHDKGAGYRNFLF